MPRLPDQPSIHGFPAVSSWRQTPQAIRALIAEYFSLRQLPELLRSPRFWMLYSLAAAPLLLAAVDIGPQGMFFYFSIVWAVILHRMVLPEPGSLRAAVAVYFGVGLVVVPILLVWVSVPPDWTYQMILPTRAWPTRLFGFVFGVGVREELCKAAPLIVMLYLVRTGRLQPLSLRQGLFLGAIAGVSFAAVENLDYWRRFEDADRILVTQGRFDPELSFGMAVSRLLLTPFMHGTWSAIVGYFLVWGERMPTQRHPIQLAGLLMGALLHGCYDASAGPLPPAQLFIIAYTFHVFTRCIAKATANETPSQILSRSLP